MNAAKHIIKFKYQYNKSPTPLRWSIDTNVVFKYIQGKPRTNSKMENEADRRSYKTEVRIMRGEVLIDGWLEEDDIL